MDNTLRELYRKLLSLRFPNGQSIFDRIKPDDLCIASHHTGRLYNNGLLICGQAMNGWQNAVLDVDGLIEELAFSSANPAELHYMADANGWHGKVNDEDVKYHYKTSRFWKLNYQVVTNAVDATFEDFYVPYSSEGDRIEVLDNAWPQNVAWTNLYKISFSKGGNPDDDIIKVINDISLQIILREIEVLKPSRILFNTGKNLFSHIALDKGNVFGVNATPNYKYVNYTGTYEYDQSHKCKIVVCRRPDVMYHYFSNEEIFEATKEILYAFDSI